MGLNTTYCATLYLVGNNNWFKILDLRCEETYFKQNYLQRDFVSENEIKYC